MHKLGATEVEMMKWQFLDRTRITPLSYNMLNWKYNHKTGCVEKANIWTDTLFGCPHVSIREWFWVGFGEYCTIPDQMIRIFLNKAKGVKDYIPTAVRRIPIDIKQKYFPYFLDVREFSGFSHILEEVGECNARCLPIVKPTFLRETETGRRQFADFEYEKGVDFGTAYLLAEQQYYKLWSDLNKAKYCCPYVTTY